MTSCAPLRQSRSAETRVNRAFCRSGIESAPQLHMVERILLNVILHCHGDCRHRAHRNRHLLQRRVWHRRPNHNAASCEHGRSLPPIFLHIITVNNHFVGGAFIKTGEIAAQHTEITTHSKSQGDMIIMDDAAVGADGNINAGFFEIFVSGFGNVDNSGGLSAANALGFTVIQMEPPPIPILMKSAPASARKRKPSASTTFPRADFHTVAVMLADPVNGALLPFREPFGRIDTKNVGAGFHQSGNTLSVISGIDRPHHIALVTIQELVWDFPYGIIVLTENKKPPCLWFRR